MKRKILPELGLVYIGVLACTFAVILLNRYVLVSLPRYGRLLCRPMLYWCIALVPLLFCVRDRLGPAELGFSKQHILRQILIGPALAAGMSALLTGVPHLLGLGELADNGSRFVHAWQYLYDFFYETAAVALTEEFIFRGYFYRRLKDVFPKEWMAVVGSSVLFGVLHVFQGNIIQVFMTTLLGAFWCVMRLKIKNCSTLSLILAHGAYDALISVWASLLLK